MNSKDVSPRLSSYIGGNNINFETFVDEIDIEFKGKLRPIQLPIIDAYMKYKSGIVSVPCGYGKTVLALDIIARLKVKTLVIVHKEFLMNQWKERIEQFVPDAKVGRIQRKNIVTDGGDIVIGVLQSYDKKWQNG